MNTKNSAFISKFQRPRNIKALLNIAWILFDRILRIGTGLFVGIWLARYLGPDQFGTLSYLISFMGVFSSLATLGLNNFVVRELVNQPEIVADTLGTAWLLQTLGGIVAAAAAIAAIFILKPHDPVIQKYIIILSTLLLIKPIEVIRYWFESQVQLKYIIWVENIILALFSTARIILILISANLTQFIWLNFAECAAVAMGLLWIYQYKNKNIFNWKIKFSQAKIMLGESWPLICSSVAVMIYMRIDQVILGQMLDNQSVGIYSAAVKISETWNFIPLAIISSMFPSIIQAKKQDTAHYHQLMQKLFNIIALISIAAASALTLFADSVVTILYGDAYLEASNSLALLSWAGLFTNLGCASGKWVAVESYFKNALLRVVFAAMINVAGNIILIPKYGIQGAAMSTLLAYSIANWLSLAVWSKTRICFRMQSKAIIKLGGII